MKVYYSIRLLTELGRSSNLPPTSGKVAGEDRGLAWTPGLKKEEEEEGRSSNLHR